MAACALHGAETVHCTSVVFEAARQRAAFCLRVLFHSGSVMEQTWEQIKGANANVFYELGLAHTFPNRFVVNEGVKP